MREDLRQKASDEQFPQYALRNRYVFSGVLKMTTGLHLGGGKATLSHTDSPVVLTPEGLPFIPGSSLKGVLRSTVEKLVASLPADLGLRSCGLPLADERENNNHDRTKPEEQTESRQQSEICPTARQKWVTGQRRTLGGEELQRFMESERKKLCNTCQLFGSPFAAARIRVNDLSLVDDSWCGTTQIRDGVAIDRDKETARPQAKYDFEVVPSTTAFAMYILIENATPQDLQLISIALSELTNGFAGIGGMRSRGLGACILDPLPAIRFMDLSKLDNEARKQRLLQYLLRKKENQEDGLEPIDYQTFIDEHITALFRKPLAQSEGRNG